MDTCTFNSDNSEAIRMDNVLETTIDKSYFNNFTKRTFYINNAKNFRVNKTVFANCCYNEKTGFMISGGVFVIENSNGKISNCNFNRCSIKNLYGTLTLSGTYGKYASGFAFSFINSKFELNSIVYSECKTYCHKIVDSEDPIAKDKNSNILIKK